MQDKVPAGCQKCGARFMLPLDEFDNPIWTHNCPKTIEEKVDDLTTLMGRIVKRLEDKDGTD